MESKPVPNISKAVKRAEFVLGDNNLPFDEAAFYLHKEHPEHWIPITSLASLDSMKPFGTIDPPSLATTLLTSQTLEVDAAGEAVRRRNPDLKYDLAEQLDRTVCGIGIKLSRDPERTLQQLQHIFEVAGPVVIIDIDKGNGQLKGDVYCEYTTAEDAAAFLCNTAAHTFGGDVIRVHSRYDRLKQISTSLGLPTPDRNSVLPHRATWTAFPPDVALESPGVPPALKVSNCLGFIDRCVLWATRTVGLEGDLRSTVLGNIHRIKQQMSVSAQLRVRILDAFQNRIVPIANDARKVKNGLDSSIYHLPAEDLDTILEYSVYSEIWPRGDRRDPDEPGYYELMMGRRLVSRRWRDAINANPALWTYISVNDSRELWWMILERSRGSPLHFDGIQHVEDVGRLLQLFQTIAGRTLKAFETNFDGEFYTSLVYRNIRDVIFKPYSALVTVDLIYDGSKRLRITGPTLGEDHPSLRHVSIEGNFAIDWPNVGLQGLETLRLCGEESTGFEPPTLAQYVGILRACPLIKHIDLTGVSMPDPHVSMDQTLNLRCDLPGLRRLQLRAVSPTTASNLLAIIITESPIEMTVMPANKYQEIDPTLAARWATFIQIATQRAVEREGWIRATSIEMPASGAGVVLQGNRYLWADQEYPVTALMDQEASIVTPVLSRLPAYTRGAITEASIRDVGLTPSTIGEPTSPLRIMTRNFSNISALTLEGTTRAIERDLREPKATNGLQGVGYGEWLLPRLKTIIVEYASEHDCRLGGLLRIVEGRNQGDQGIDKVASIILKAPSWSEEILDQLQSQMDGFNAAGVLVDYHDSIETLAEPAAVVTNHDWEDDDSSEGESGGGVSNEAGIPEHGGEDDDDFQRERELVDALFNGPPSSDEEEEEEEEIEEA